MLRPRRAIPLLSCRRALLTTSSSSHRKLNPNTLFSKGQHSDTEVTAALAEHHLNLTFAEISKILFVSSLNYYVLNPDQLHYVECAVQQKRGHINPKSISKFFYGLKLQSSDNQSVLGLLRAVYPLLARSNKQLKQTFSGQAIGEMVYGFQRISSKHLEVRNIISYFTEVIEDCEDKLDAKNMSRLLLGIQHFESEYVEVRMFLQSIVRNLQSCDKSYTNLNCHLIANMTCGFKSLNDSHAEVKDLLRWVASVTTHFTAQTPATNLKWSSSDISTALYGLQRRGIQISTNNSNITQESDKERKLGGVVFSNEVLELLTQLNFSFFKSKTEFNVKHIGRAMFCLSKMSSEYEAVRNVVSTLASKVKQQRLLNGRKYFQTIPDFVLAKALHGLRSMTSDHAEVREVVALLTDMLLFEGRGDMDVQATSMAMYGISNLSSEHEEVQSLLEVLNKRLLAASKREAMTSFGASNLLFSMRIFQTNGFVATFGGSSTVTEKELLIRGQLLQTIIRGLQARQSRHIHLDGLAVRGALKGLSHLSLDIPEVSRLLEVLLQKAKRVHHNSTCGSSLNGYAYPISHFTPDHAAGALGTFQNVTSDRVVVKQWLRFLGETLREGMQTSPPSVYYLVRGYKGLRKMNSQCEDVRIILKVLYLTINAFKKPSTASSHSAQRFHWTSGDISLVLNSLQNMDCFHDEVRNTLKALLLKSEFDMISPEELSLSLYGMRNMTPAYVEVRDTLSMLYGGIVEYLRHNDSATRKDIGARSVTTCLYGMQNMSSSFKEVKDLLLILESAIVQCPRTFNSEEIGRAYLGLQSMDIVDDEVIRVLKALNDNVEAFSDPLSHRTVSDILYGMQRCGIRDHEEVVRAVDWLHRRCTSPKPLTTISTSHSNAFNVSEVARSIYGLMCMIRKESLLLETDSSMQLLNKFLSETIHHTTKNQHKFVTSEKDILQLYRSLILLSHHSFKALPPCSQDMLNALVSHLEPHISSITDDMVVHESSTEKRFATVAKKLLESDEGGNYDVLTSSMLHGFSCDLIIRSLSSGAAFNIELDGPAHQLPRKKLLCDLRDSLLEGTVGGRVRVVRVDLCGHFAGNDEAISAILKSELSLLFPEV